VKTIGKTVFEGEWENSEIVEGRCTYPNGNYYEGEWKEGKPEGRGKMVMKKEDGAITSSYEGEFWGGKPCNRGVKIDENGKKTAGYWVGGKFFPGEPPAGVLEQ